MDARPTLIVLAGPNGAGKSTLYQTRVAPRFAGPFINADLIQHDELGKADPSAAYDAARIASERRADHIARGLDFVTETVFSHPSKLALIEEATAAGFDVIVMHVGVETPDLSVARVAARVEEGGHAVPEDKVRARYARNGALIRRAALMANAGLVFDNSQLNRPPKRCLVFQDGRLVHERAALPQWIRTIYARDLGADLSSE
ncbi:MAG: zeta toxin family protein [Pseudomonadota bacterium]